MTDVDLSNWYLNMYAINLAAICVTTLEQCISSSGIPLFVTAGVVSFLAMMYVKSKLNPTKFAILVCRKTLILASFLAIVYFILFFAKVVLCVNSPCTYHDTSLFGRETIQCDSKCFITSYSAVLVCIAFMFHSAYRYLCLC
jgi:hypothetical protein